MLYRKKPIVVEANQWFPQPPPTPTVDDLPGKPRRPELYGVRYCPPTKVDDARRGIKFDRPGRYVIDTLEGVMDVSPGDWIVKGVVGERYPVKPHIFVLTYEVATGFRYRVGWLFNHWRRK